MTETHSKSAAPVDEVVALLRSALDQPQHRDKYGQEAAALWWRLDDEGLTGGDPPEAWEEALLGLAAWHTRDDRLRLQRINDDEITVLLEVLDGG